MAAGMGAPVWAGGHADALARGVAPVFAPWERTLAGVRFCPDVTRTPRAVYVAKRACMAIFRDTACMGRRIMRLMSSPLATASQAAKSHRGALAPYRASADSLV